MRKKEIYKDSARVLALFAAVLVRSIFVSMDKYTICMFEEWCLREALLITAVIPVISIMLFPIKIKPVVRKKIGRILIGVFKDVTIPTIVCSVFISAMGIVNTLSVAVAVMIFAMVGDLLHRRKYGR